MRFKDKKLTQMFHFPLYLCTKYEEFNIISGPTISKHSSFPDGTPNTQQEQLAGFLRRPSKARIKQLLVTCRWKQQVHSKHC